MQNTDKIQTDKIVECDKGRALAGGSEQARERLRCVSETERLLPAFKRRYPLMNHEDAVKLAFQGMLGVGHLVASFEAAEARLRTEMEGLEPSSGEPLIEPISSEWFRLNLRAAKARGISEETIARMLFLSAAQKPCGFTRRDVYDLCVRLDASDEMRDAAGKILDESFLPSHSEAYREAYRPAYRVLHVRFIDLKFSPEEETAKRD
ncbi:MAG: hypothetical protein II920_05985 [Clostridia bacterium]|nr:hypothetical protein [Clostridia bacterium]